MSDFYSCPFILIRMAYIVGRLVSICASSNVTFGISLHEVYVWVAGGRTLRRNKLSRMDSLPNFLTRGAALRSLRPRESTAKIRWTLEI